MRQNIIKRSTELASTLNFLFAISVSLSTHAEVATPLTHAERVFVGEYVQSSSETIAQMAILEDRTFCFAFIGGSADLLLAGHWNLIPDGKGIRLKELKAPQPQFPVLANLTGASATSTFEIDGYSMSYAEKPVFAYSSSNAEPSEYRRLFADTHNSWAERYTLPPVPASEARYFYIGSAENDPYASIRKGPTRFKVVQYELRGSAQVLVGFNAEQQLIDLSQPVRMVGEVLHFGPRSFAKRRPISAARAEKARENCVRPMLEQSGGKPRAPEFDLKGRTELVPIKTFYIDHTRVKSAPWFQSEEF